MVVLKFLKLGQPSRPPKIALLLQVLKDAMEKGG
jgi:hypothetical protein